jgi:O-methyltransferase involved in polyketide biosynthesis
MFDYSWLEDVNTPQDGHVLVLAAGLFFYFEESQIREMFRKISERFPHGRLFFESCSKCGMKIANRMVKKTGNIGAEMKFWTDNAAQVKAWSPRITEADCLPFFGGVYKDKRLSRFTRLIMWGADFLNCVKLVRVVW